MKTIEDMAQKYSEIMLKKEDVDFDKLGEMAKYCFEFAEAMQAEAEKRKHIPDARSLTKDEKGNCLHFHHEFGHKKCMDCGASLKDWQPDWSQAPTWANYWFVTGMKDPFAEVYWSDTIPCYRDEKGQTSSGRKLKAPSFNYQGDWRDSLRKRP